MTASPSVQATPNSLWSRLTAPLAMPVDGASLAAFRICFGLVMFWHVAEYLWPAHGTNYMRFLYVDTAWNFSYPGFQWVRPWPEPLLTAHFALLALAGACLAVGFCYRAAAVTLCLGYTYVFLLEQTRYNNHYYLMCLLAFLLIGMPAQTSFSLDAWLRSRRARTVPPHDPSCLPTVPFWPLLLLRAQLFIVYFYGGVAKIDADWLSGVPMRSPANKLRELLGQLALPQLVSVEHVCLLLAWGGLAFDLAIGFLLFFRRTRWLALVLLAFFHGTNNFLFRIGVFPILAFTASLVFFPPDWPRRFGRWLARPRLARPDWAWLIGGAVTLPLVGALLGWKSAATAKPRDVNTPLPPRLIVAFVVIWLTVQVLVPLRHFAIAGDASWTEEGHRFAWRMMLVAKTASPLMYQVHDSDLKRVDGRGRSRFRWDVWSGRQALFMPVDSHRFNWSNHDVGSVIYEPCLGERIVFTPRGLSDEALAERCKEIAADFRQCLGREPRIEESVSLQCALRGLRERFQSLVDSGADQAARGVYPTCLEHVSAALELASAERGGEQQAIDMVARLQEVVDSAGGDVARSYLRRVHPFALQGATYPGQRFLLVEDPLLADDERDDALRRLGLGNPYPVWFDQVRLRPDDWRGLPRAFVMRGSREANILWNCSKELNASQLGCVNRHPDMIRQYARRIADLWEAETGRRPKVFALSIVMLNGRRPQPLVDPQVDLASVDYRFWVHNPWILPRPERLQTTRGPGNRLR